ncbi:Tn3 family transposase [Streptomyces bambusae]|uniref:Tn3 family transposase n=1 Tax=Streptomyces bambusae TaxID=1550616 RepID=UPI001CA5CA48|nr:Tn3 family transposase [Streptomyces bambusae]
MLDNSYSYLRQFTPDVLKAVEFTGGTGAETLMEAVTVLKKLNADGARKVPDGAPTDFVPCSVDDRAGDEEVLRRPRPVDVPAVRARRRDPPPSPAAQTEQAWWCLTLLTNSVVTWTTEYYGLAIAQMRAEGRAVDDELLAHISPAHSENVNFFGTINVEVDAELAKLDPAGYQPLRPPPTGPALKRWPSRVPGPTTEYWWTAYCTWCAGACEAARQSSRSWRPSALRAGARHPTRVDGELSVRGAVEGAVLDPLDQ